MVESINHISQIVGKQTIAEFVGNYGNFALLRNIGVDRDLGYSIGIPKPLRVGKYVHGAPDALNR